MQGYSGRFWVYSEPRAVASSQMQRLNFMNSEILLGGGFKTASDVALIHFINYNRIISMPNY